MNQAVLKGLNMEVLQSYTNTLTQVVPSKTAALFNKGLELLKTTESLGAFIRSISCNLEMRCTEMRLVRLYYVCLKVVELELEEWMNLKRLMSLLRLKVKDIQMLEGRRVFKAAANK